MKKPFRFNLQSTICNLKSRMGFTLFEVMTAFAILIILLYALYIVFDQASRVIEQGTGKTDQYQNARVVIEQMAREISQAIIGTGGPNASVRPYILGRNDSITYSGQTYNRDSIFFIIPTGIGYNEIGYYIDSGSAGLKDEILTRCVTTESSTNFDIDSTGDFGSNSSFATYVTDLNIEYKSNVLSVTTTNEWDSRISGSTSSTLDDAMLPKSVIITLKTTSKKALETTAGVPAEGDKTTFTIEIPVSEIKNY